jgi:hypothetical protein
LSRYRNHAKFVSVLTAFHLQSALGKFCELDLHFELFRIEIAQGLSVVHRDSLCTSVSVAALVASATD